MLKRVPDDAILIPPHAARVFKGVIYDVYQWDQPLFDGSPARFEMLRRPDTVSAICMTDEGIVVINDEQPHRGQRLSFPGGRVDEEDADIMTAAQREVLEETGYTFRHWRLVKVWQPQAKIEWFIHLYIAWDVVTKGVPHLDAGEKITLDHRTFEEVLQLVLKKNGVLGEIGSIFETIKDASELLALPQFEGKEIER
jgi:ADP-ribose pyrophosphatase